MNNELSILIPAYNNSCINLVRILQEQADSISNLNYEIIVADDGSTNSQTIETNEAINTLVHCHYIYRTKNSGRAAIRNFLSAQARYSWLLFLDCDVRVFKRDFLRTYLSACTNDISVIYGGVTTNGEIRKGNLRWTYEQKEEQNHLVTLRRQHPYQAFRTTNFAISSKAILRHPFDETFTTYGYEDVIFGKLLYKGNEKIEHIDNPVLLGIPEDNSTYINKVEEALTTLYQYKDQLQDYSPLLNLCNKISNLGLTRFFALWHQAFGRFERLNLTGNHPSTFLLKLYKVGFFISIRRFH